MSDSKQGYKVEKRNRVNRYRTRAVYDYDFIHNTVNQASVINVAFPPALNDQSDEFPALLPMIGVMAKYRDERYDDETDQALDLYIHGYVSSRLMRLADSAQKDEDGEDRPGFPLTASATIVDGIVLALTPNNHSYNYRSAVLQGYGVPVTDTEEKLWAMEAVTNKVIGQRWENTRVPPTQTEMTTTNILRVTIVSASGKQRHGQPHDEKFDLEDKQVRDRVWTGVIPVWEQRGTPVRGAQEAKSKAPGHITLDVDKKNAEFKAQAMANLKE